MEYPKEYPKLKFPAHQTLEAAHMARLDTSGESFAKAVYAAMRSGEADGDKWIDGFRNESYFFEYDRLANTVNHAYDLVRMRICAAAEKYLLAHDGVVDVWPDAVGEGVHQFSRKDAETGKVYPVGTVVFDYFGDDYVEKLGTLRRKKKGFVYRNGRVNKYNGIDGHAAAVKKSKELKQEMEEAEGRTNALAELGMLVGGPYLALGTLCLLACMFFGFGGVISGLFSSLEGMPGDSPARTLLQILYIVVFLPGILYGWIALLSGKLYWILTVLLLLVCAGGAVLCFLGYREFHEFSVLAKQAKKAWRAYIESDEYTLLMRENRETLAENTAFAEEWQRAWYNWVCSVRKAPDSSEALDQKLRENKAGAKKGKTGTR